MGVERAIGDVPSPAEAMPGVLRNPDGDDVPGGEMGSLEAAVLGIPGGEGLVWMNPVVQKMYWKAGREGVRTNPVQRNPRTNLMMVAASGLCVLDSLTTGENLKEDVVPVPMFVRVGVEALLDECGFKDEEWKSGVDREELSHDMIAFAQAATELSWLESYGDGLFTLRAGLGMLMLSALARGNELGVLWDEIGSGKLGACASALSVSEGVVVRVFGNLGLDGKAVMQNLVGWNLLIGNLAEGNTERLLEIMRRDPGAMIHVGGYITTLVRAGLAEKYGFGDDLLEKVALTFAAVERDFEGNERIKGAIQSRYSMYMNLLMDFVVHTRAKSAFAMADTAMRGSLNMSQYSFLQMVKAVRMNASFQGMGLRTLEEMPDTKGYGVLVDPDDLQVTVAYKSVFTALGEVLSSDGVLNELVLLARVLEVVNETEVVGIPSQMERDVKLIKLLDSLMKFDDDEVGKLLKKIRKKLERLNDRVRGTVYPDDVVFDKLVEEAVKQTGLRVVVILNAHDGDGDDFRCVDLSDTDAVNSLRDELEASDEMGISDLLEIWYKKNNGRFPYGAVHVYGKSWFVPHPVRLYDRNGDELYKKRQDYELRMVPKSRRQEMMHARIPFKKIAGSGHV